MMATHEMSFAQGWQIACVFWTPVACWSKRRPRSCSGPRSTRRRAASSPGWRGSDARQRFSSFAAGYSVMGTVGGLRWRWSCARGLEIGTG